MKKIWHRNKLEQKGMFYNNSSKANRTSPWTGFFFMAVNFIQFFTAKCIQDKQSAGWVTPGLPVSLEDLGPYKKLVQKADSGWEGKPH